MLLAADPDFVSSVSFVVTTPGEFRTSRLTRMPLRGIDHLDARQDDEPAPHRFESQ
jgi:hypothetical protein